ncbi:MAG: VanZ family protein [Candidatus Shapirobacteria bacterium]
MKKVIRFLPALIWMVIIFYFSSRQTTGIGGDSYWLRFFVLKSFHLIEYALLVIFLFLGFKKYKWSFLIAYIYAFSDEIHQYFIPGRTGKLRDTFFDLAGILIGLLIIKFFKKKLILKL